MKQLFSLLFIFALISIACSFNGLIPTETPSPLPSPSWKLVSTAPPTSAQPIMPPPTSVPAPIKIPTPIKISTQNSVARIGEMVEQGGYQLTVMNIEFADSYSDYFKADAGNHFLAVNILIQSNAPSDVNVNPFYVKVKDSDGYEYSMTAFGKDPSLQSQNDLPQGEKMRGWVTFQVPLSAHDFVLSYEPMSFTNPVRILVDLGQ